jgi:hypothetical protein
MSEAPCSLFAIRECVAHVVCEVIDSLKCSSEEIAHKLADNHQKKMEKPHNDALVSHSNIESCEKDEKAEKDEKDEKAEKDEKDEKAEKDEKDEEEAEKDVALKVRKNSYFFRFLFWEP